VSGPRGEPGPRRAARMLRWYPASWRSRYGEEFAELLLAELADRPQDWRRTADVIRTGLLARLAAVGLTRHALNPVDQIRASLATLSCAAAVFLVFGMAMLAQLAIGWQWASPRAAATTSGIWIMGAAAGALAVLALLAAIPAGCGAVAGLIRQRSHRLAWAAGIAVAGAAALLAGAHHFQNAWPGTGGTAAHRGVVPAGLAAFSWASTLSVSSYWAHPAALHSFPGPELAWMALSPLALLGLVGGAAGIVRRQRTSSRMLTYQARLATAAAVVMGGFLVGAADWVFGQGSGSAGLFHAGAVDVAGLAVMTVALAAGGQRPPRRAGPHPLSLAGLTGAVRWSRRPGVQVSGDRVGRRVGRQHPGQRVAGFLRDPARGGIVFLMKKFQTPQALTSKTLERPLGQQPHGRRGHAAIPGGGSGPVADLRPVMARLISLQHDVSDHAVARVR
jgi:hypothetical protein